MSNVGRNAPCPCGSGKRYKDCHGAVRVAAETSALPQGSVSIDRQRRMFAALSAQQAGRMAEAGTLYQSVLDEEPDNFDALHMLGVVDYERGELTRAEALLERAIALQPRIEAARDNLRLVRTAQARRNAEERLCREVETFAAARRSAGADPSPSAIRVIAFYLPQYHAIPENDRWWGEGYTEWTRVRKAVPNFVGHQQPHEPAELGYYDLRSSEVRERQAALARESGIHGFCYYVYWFNGKRMLERPLEEMLASGKPDFPFCICWANENWTRRWDGLDREILIGQEYSAEDSKAFIRHFLPALADSRYIRVNGRPLLLVYRLDLIPHAREMAEIWRAEARRYGVGELYLCAARSTFEADPSAFGFDAAVEFPPHGFQAYRLNAQVEITNPQFRGLVFNYRDQVTQSLAAPRRDYTLFRGVMPAWDNTARRQHDSTVFVRSSPDTFAYWLHAMIEQTRRRLPAAEQLVFVNAWNEWGEGCHLEPDRRYGREYLTAVESALALPTRDWPAVVPLELERDASAVLTEYEHDPSLRVRRFGWSGATGRAALVSVVMPVFNHARFLRETMGSVFAQSHRAIELIIVDDGSDDGSFELLIELARAAPFPVVLIGQPNAGAPAALNRGLAVARGDYVATLNSDDLFLPRRIETMLAALRRGKAMLAFSDVEFIGEDNAMPCDQRLPRELRERIDAIGDHRALLYSMVLSNVAISTGNLLFERKLLSVTGGFRDLKLCHDWDFLLAASYAGPPVFVAEPLYRYRLHAANTFASLRLHAAEETEAVYQRFFAAIERHPDLRHRDAREQFLRFAHEHDCRGYFAVPNEWRYRDYAEWVALHDTLDDTRRDELRCSIAALPRQPLLSILLPTHNSDERWLRRCVDTVRAQLYPAWELCIADDASSDSRVRVVLDEYRALDSRIKVAYRTDNGHISRASNSALELATGEFVVLLDHDDELTEDALYWVAREIIDHPDAILIYSDEDKISESGVRLAPYFKADWNPELLRAQNCVSHLGAIRSEALRTIGGFRAGLEGAQDWDVALRLSERCRPERVRHIPRILYHWRLSADSTSGGMERKSYAAAAQRQVLAEHLARIDRPATIEPIVRGNFWRIDYAVQPELRATLIIDGRGPLARLRDTLDALTRTPDTLIGSLQILVDDPEAERLAVQIVTPLGIEFSVMPCAKGARDGALWNAACRSAGEIIVLLKAGVAELTPRWCERLLGYAIDPSTGVVAPALVRPDRTFHNAGLLLDPDQGTVRALLGKPMALSSFGARGELAQNLSVPGSECLAFRRDIHVAAGGFDERLTDPDLLAADFCLRSRSSGLWNVWTPYVEAIWTGQRASRWATRDSGDIAVFISRWRDWLVQDPAYNPNLAGRGRTFELAFPPRHRAAVAARSPLAVETNDIGTRDHA